MVKGHSMSHVLTRQGDYMTRYDLCDTRRRYDKNVNNNVTVTCNEVNCTRHQHSTPSREIDTS